MGSTRQVGVAGHSREVTGVFFWLDCGQSKEEEHLEGGLFSNVRCTGSVSSIWDPLGRERDTFQSCLGSPLFPAIRPTDLFSNINFILCALF